MLVNISEAKAQLSKLIHCACEGQEVIIAKNGVPLVDIVSHQPKSPIKLGLLANQADLNTYDESLLNEDESMNALFYSADIEPK